jgi:hypothetical protein
VAKAEKLLAERGGRPLPKGITPERQAAGGGLWRRRYRTATTM